MAFHDIRLRDDIEQGATGGPSFKTTIFPLSSGHEQRNIDWEYPRAMWDIAYGIQTKSDLEEVIQFFYARQGRAHTFRFKDWSDYEAVEENIGTGNGVLTTFQLTKAYTSGLVAFKRKIYLPIADSVNIYVNGVQKINWTLNALTGVLTFIDPDGGGPGVAAPPNGHAITADFEFDNLVRFDVDQLNLSVIWADAMSAPGIKVVEVRLP